MAAQVFIVKHYNGQATTTPEKVSLGRRGHRLVIKNLSTGMTAQKLLISFDGGRSVFTIPSGDPPLSLDVAFHYFVVSCDANTCDWCALVSEG